MIEPMAPRRGLGSFGRERFARLIEEAEFVTPQSRPNPAALSLEEAPRKPLEWRSFDSSRVAEAAYDAEAERLTIRWVKPGPAYDYEGVPPNVWRNMRRAKSAGKYVNRVLNQYDYHPTEVS